MQIYLASRSPRRQQLLQQVAIDFQQVDIDVDEHWSPQENAGCYVKRLACDKAMAGFAATGKTADAVVIGADTAVVIDDDVLGKAANPEQASSMLRRLSGRRHHVYTAVAVVTATDHQVLCSRTAVCFKTLTDKEIHDYCRSGEAVGKAGGYAIQGRAALFVESMQGSYSGVVGLPLYETCELLAPYLD